MFVETGGMLAHCAMDGPATAPPLLLLHSIGTTHDIWDAQARALARRFRVIRPDLRGHGLSEVTPGDYTMAGLAQDILSLLDALGIAAAHLAGTSIGGRIAQQVAADAPERVLSLCLLNTALEFPSPPIWQARIDDVRREGTQILADAVMPRWVVDTALPSSQGLRRMLLRTDKVGYAGAACALRDATAAELEGRITAPCTIIAGERDPAAPATAVAQLRAAIPGAALTVLPGAGHITTYEFGDDVSAAMLAHFDRLGVG
jgi:3-oxoadipate enol-lactonase